MCMQSTSTDRSDFRRRRSAERGRTCAVSAASSVESDRAFEAIACVIIIGTLTVGLGMGYALARTIDAVWP